MNSNGRLKKRSALVFIVALGLSGVLSPEAQAQRALTPAELYASDPAAFKARYMVVEETLTFEPLPPSAFALVHPFATSVTCTARRATGRGKARAGNTLYTFYVEGSWCGDGTSVSSVRFRAARGETATAGWSYKGVIAKGAGGGGSSSGRFFARHKFQLKAGPVVVQTTKPCLRLIGFASLSRTQDKTCSVS